MAVSSRKVAELLATRLNRILPGGLSAASNGVSVGVYGRGRLLCGSGAAIIIEDGGGSEEDRLETAIRAVLSAVQDCVMSSLSRQWPVASDGTVGMPDARIAGGRAHLWFGSEHSPIAFMPPIEIAELSEIG